MTTSIRFLRSILNFEKLMKHLPQKSAIRSFLRNLSPTRTGTENPAHLCRRSAFGVAERVFNRGIRLGILPIWPALAIFCLFL